MAKRKLTTSAVPNDLFKFATSAASVYTRILNEPEAVCRFAEAILRTPHVFEQVCRELPERTKLDAVAIAAVKLSHAIRRELKGEGGDGI